MTQKLIQIGNSTGVIIPAEELEKLGLSKGDTVDLDIKPAGKLKSTKVTPEFLDWADSFNKEYGESLQKLANV